MKIKLYKPYLDLYLDLGFVSVRTSLMHQSYERYEYDYIVLGWRLFKLNGGFKLYKPGRDNS